MARTGSPLMDQSHLRTPLAGCLGVGLVIALMTVDARVAEGQEVLQRPLVPPSLQPVPAPDPSRVPQDANTGSQSRGGRMGVRIRNAEGSDGVVVTSIEPDSPAQRTGLKLGDRIVSVQRRMVVDTSGLIRDVSSNSPGASITLHVVRDAQLHDFRIALAGEGLANSDVPTVQSPSTEASAATAKLNADPQQESAAVALSTRNNTVVAAAGEFANDALALDDDEPIDTVIFETVDESATKLEGESKLDRVVKLKAEIKRLQDELERLDNDKQGL